MVLRDIFLKQAYDSDEDDILNDFYVPALTNSTSYKRLAGFFSSTALAAAARGICGLIKNGGTMKLVVGAKLRKQDIEAIERGTKSREQAVSELILGDLGSFESEFVKDHVRALAFMIAAGKLEIKVAIPVSASSQDLDDFEGIYHMKVGIFSDGSESVSFSGSVNESRMGWLHSIEEFKVFCSWIIGQETYLERDVEKFEKYWNGLARRAIVFDVPTAIRNKLIDMAPESMDTLQLQRYYSPRIPPSLEPFRLRAPQTNAVQAWVKNGYRGILAMATGTGKTYAALAAASLAPASVITVILVPTDPILRQWSETAIPRFAKNAEIICCSGNFKWRELLPPRLSGVRRLGAKWSPERRLYVVATMDTASSESFLLSWKGVPEGNVQVICDEVHHLGAPKYQLCTRLDSVRRLGLSATPERYWDPQGTLKTVDYIGPTVYEYPIRDAIRDGFLCHYLYVPHFAFLDGSEFEEFCRLTEEIARESSKISTEDTKNASKMTVEQSLTRPTMKTSSRIERLCEERAKIKKKAKDKIRVLGEILDNSSVRPLIIFCEDDTQIVEVRETLNKRALSFGVYTSTRTPDSWQRTKVLESFKKGDIDILLGIRCLDEGLDVPDCRGCIIIASSSSTREFVQRRGRILRGLKGKVAALDDIIVLPPKIKDVVEIKMAEILIRQEVERMKQLIDAADNWATARNMLSTALLPYGLEGLAYL